MALENGSGAGGRTLGVGREAEIEETYQTTNSLLYFILNIYPRVHYSSCIPSFT